MAVDDYHIPVLLNESIQAMDIQPNGIYVDATLGGGGHARRILEVLGPEGRLIVFDQDPAAAANVPGDERVTFIPQNFRHLLRFARFAGFPQADGILADLGVSSHQFDTPERGFSYRYPEEILDMRMDTRSGIPASDLLNREDPAALQKILGVYGEVRNARTLAQALVRYRERRPFARVGDLLEALQPVVRGDRHRYMAQVFQALRIAVNGEMDALEGLLTGALELLNPGGRLVILTYHSLEDRMVKQFLKTGNVRGEVEKDFYGNIHRPFEILTRNPVKPGEEELTLNTRAHSAKMRVARKRKET